MGIPRALPISSRLYLFCNADLLAFCGRPDTAVSAPGFIDDVKISAYGTGTEKMSITERDNRSKCEPEATLNFSPRVEFSYFFSYLRSQEVWGSPNSRLRLRLQRQQGWAHSKSSVCRIFWDMGGIHVCPADILHGVFTLYYIDPIDLLTWAHEGCHHGV